MYVQFCKNTNTKLSVKHVTNSTFKIAIVFIVSFSIAQILLTLVTVPPQVETLKYSMKIIKYWKNYQKILTTISSFKKENEFNTLCSNKLQKMQRSCLMQFPLLHTHWPSYKFLLALQRWYIDYRRIVQNKLKLYQFESVF